MKVGKGALWASLGLAVTSVGAGTNDFTVTGCVSVDISSGYVLYGARINDEPCYWTYGELNFGYKDWGSIGVSVWQNTDMTARRKETMRQMNEWDWAVFGRSGLNFGQGICLSVEAGHIWYMYPGVRSVYASYYHTMEEWFCRLSLENSLLIPYFEISYDHKVYKGAFLSGGLRRKFNLPLGLTLMPDITIGGGSRNYNAGMYPPYDGSVTAGVTFAQVAGTLAYWFNEHLGVHVKVAYAVLTDSDIRRAVSQDGGTLANQFVWGMVGVDIAF